MKEYIVDACVLVGFLKNEKSASIFVEYLDKSFENQAQLIANSVNLGEFYFSASRYVNSNIVDEFLQDLEIKYSLKIYNPTYQDCLESAKIKATGGIAYFDCFNLVVAKKYPKAQILTLDKEYKKFENEYNINFL